MQSEEGRAELLRVRLLFSTNPPHLSNIPEMESFISSELTEETNFRIPGKVDFLLSTLVYTDRRSSVPPPKSTSRNSAHLYYLVLLFSASPQVRMCGWTPPSPGKEAQKLLSGECSAEGDTTPARPPDLSHSDHGQDQRTPPSEPVTPARPGIQVLGRETRALTRPPGFPARTLHPQSSIQFPGAAQTATSVHGPAS